MSLTTNTALLTAAAKPTGTTASNGAASPATPSSNPANGRNACLVLDLAANAPAHAMFAKAGIQNWRSLAADDCSVVRSEKATETSPLKVYAVFYLDPLPA